MSATAAFTAERISVRYQTRSGVIDALRDIDLRIEEGEFVALLGPSGCGKSTLLKVAAGLISPTEGRASIGGKQLDRPGRDVGVAFQKPNLLPWKTVLSNVMLPAQTLRLPKAPALTRARDLLELVGLAAFADNYPSELSGGMQQRVGLARMLLHDPELLLMDEPFAALDAMTRESLTLELQRIWLAQRKSVLFITHSIPEAVFLADRVVVMSARPGRIIDDFAVPLDRPRTADTMASAAFVDACRYLRGHFQ
ncbi:MAG: ABC transporter ATP-binding protein [Pseudomonadota bacterium]|jgi:NitT/TauT family transport system ATP-binding protein|uniref:Hydroxymethylpyrimidine ABC transporter, ATPase component n=1 Tax=Caballeronia sordidicola TaxID=196367 RepID=A0A242MHF3_CABSO|nr:MULTISPECIES: ABC transporter ATP-binding protein [Burkholderiaceae]MDP9152704.1 ABC transporter ATP-binding protein [Pseudomonadota bacterium]AMH42950.1 ABC transporter [Burkholderia sp. PAMC 26561]AMM16083.1 ABC transporter [Burkholderia sp. PAMC 28687]OTP70586.1 Hydroxymethylpyrimidine ABC transporter, ATPase component [Caballeronia sordidicola]OTP75560.1 Hydroxymethylpyrimidine ABC transporter, ATPase component [Caballeronia sordidicola]